MNAEMTLSHQWTQIRKTAGHAINRR